MSFTVQIYDGAGAEAVCVGAMERELRNNIDTNRYKIERFNGRSVRPLSQCNVEALILPGGFALRMGAELDQLANQINEVVNCDFGAGVYLSCAGAIATSSTHTTARGTTDNLFSKLRLHDADTYFPYFLPDKGTQGSPLNLMNIEVTHSEDLLGTGKQYFYHALAPGFTLDPLKHKEYKVLASYSISGDWPKALAATILRDRKQEYLTPPHPILATGIHPEINVEDLISQKEHLMVGDSSHHFDALKSRLEENGPIRQQVLRKYFEHIGLKLFS